MFCQIIIWKLLIKFEFILDDNLLHGLLISDEVSFDFLRSVVE